MRKTKAGDRRLLPLIWTTQIMLYAGVERQDGRGAVVVISPANDKYIVIGLESPTKSRGVADILSNHAHSDLGMFKTNVAAMKAGQRWLTKWLNAKRPSPKCKCEDVHA